MSDYYQGNPPPELRTAPPWKLGLFIAGMFGALVFLPPLMAWWMGDPAYLFGWVLLLLLGLA